LLKAAVEGALTAEWRAQNPPQETGTELLARILRERRARWEASQLARFQAEGRAPPEDWPSKYQEPARPDTAGLPSLPAGWIWASAEQLCGFITKGTTPPKAAAERSEKTVPFLRVTNLTQTGALDFTEQVFVSEATHHGFLARSVVYPGDLLMNIVGPPLGQVSVVPTSYPEWNVNQAIAIFRPVPGLSAEFLKLALLSPVAQQWLKERAKTTAGQTNLTLELCRAMPIPLPPVAEQLEVARVADQAIDALSALDTARAHALRLAAAQRQNILRAAFAGQLVPQDPTDEPASVLLARIRAEREATPAAARRPRKQGA
jgi:type I restriction enzyme S subunit